MSASQVLIFTETSRSKKPPKKAKPPAAVALKMLQKTMQWKSSEEKLFLSIFFSMTLDSTTTPLSLHSTTPSLSLSTTPSALHSRVCNPVTHTRVRTQYPVTARTQSCRARAHARTHTHTRCSAALSTRHEKAPAQHPPAPACCSSATHTHTVDKTHHPSASPPPTAIFFSSHFGGGKRKRVQSTDGVLHITVDLLPSSLLPVVSPPPAHRCLFLSPGGQFSVSLLVVIAEAGGSSARP